ncbi:MAG: hypothetical protein V4731_08175 [Pseudomonadota bacterium]
MGNTSIGSGGGRDSNENPLSDSTPSKTLGAESGRSDGRNADPKGILEGDESEAGLTSGEELLRESPAQGAPVDPGYYPDGPNVEASPGELDAARGKPSDNPRP